MLLLPAILAGWLVGVVRARSFGRPYQLPELRFLWLVFIAFLPQFAILYLPGLRRQIPDSWSAILLSASQLILLGFAWLNRTQPGMGILFAGAALNFTVMAANRGFMPISPRTAGRLDPDLDVPPGSRFGLKDILLPPEATRFEWLADRFLPPAWFPYQVAFSAGDVLIALGVFVLLARQDATTRNST